MNICENHSDFTSCKLITIFVKIFALINSWHSLSEVHLCHFICAHVNEQKFVSNWHYHSHGINKYISIILFIPFFCHYIVPSSSVNVPPFFSYKTHITCNSLHYVKFACVVFIDKYLPKFRAHCFTLHILWI